MIRPRRGLGEAGDRQGRGVGREHRLGRQRGLGLPGGLGLDLAVLEHRLDHQLAVLQRTEVRRRGDLGQHRVGPGLVETAALHQLAQLVGDVRLALVGGRLVAVDQHDVEAGLHRDGGDARAHQAGAEDAEPPVLLLRHALRPARELVGLLQAEEQRADHALGDRIAQQRHEIARLDLERGVERQLQALVDAAHDRLGRRIDAVGLAGDHRVAADEGLHAGRTPHLASREARRLEAGPVPRLHGARVDGLGALSGIGRHDGLLGLRGQPRLGAGEQFVGRHDLMDQAHAFGGLDRQVLALEQDRRGVHHADQARDALGAAAARQQAELDLGLADPGPRVGRGDAVVAGERDLEAAAQRGAVDRRHDRLTAGLLVAEQPLQLAELLGELGRIRGVGVQEHLEIGAGDEIGLSGGDDDALHLVVLERRLERPGIGRDRALVQHVHGAVRHVPGDGGDAVTVDVVGDH